MSFFFGFTCDCGMDLEADIVVDYAGCQGSTTGPFESSYPGEAAEWHLAEPVICEDSEWLTGAKAGQKILGCGKIWKNEEIAARFEDEIQQRISEPPGWD